MQNNGLVWLFLGVLASILSTFMVEVSSQKGHLDSLIGMEGSASRRRRLPLRISIKVGNTLTWRRHQVLPKTLQHLQFSGESPKKEAVNGSPEGGSRGVSRSLGALYQARTSVATETNAASKSMSALAFSTAATPRSLPASTAAGVQLGSYD